MHKLNVWLSVSWFIHMIGLSYRFRAQSSLLNLTSDRQEGKGLSPVEQPWRDAFCCGTF